MIELYIVIAVLISLMNLMPAFMPPTWAVLAFFYLTFDLSLLPTVVIGASAATLGRIGLAYLSRSYFRRFLTEKARNNYESLGHFLRKKRHITIPLIISYAFIPIPSNHVYIAVGLSKVNIKIFAATFFVGRLVSYAFWVAAAHTLNESLNGIFVKHFRNPESFVVDLIGLAFLYVLSQIDWKRFIK